MDLVGKTALITGGGKRVGAGISRELARAGANIVISYNTSADDAEQTRVELEAAGTAVLVVEADVTDYEAVAAMVAAATSRFGTIDVLVNNASTFTPSPIPTDDLAAWHQSIDTLVHGPFYCANLVAPHMLANGGGVIVGIGDLSVFEPWPGFTGHSVGKSAMLALTRQLALELAPTIRANAVVLGPALRPDTYDDERYRKTAEKTLLGRWGTPTEMGHAVRFLCEADYVTGEVITVDGGQRYGHRKPVPG